LQQHLNNPLLSLDWLQVTLKGQVVDLEGECLWKLVQRKKLMFIDKRKVQTAVQQGAAVVLEGLDILDPGINQLLAELEKLLPCALTNAEAFFSQRGNEAYTGHRDSDDVLVIQISGRKHWYLHRPQQRRYFGNAGLSKDQMGPVLAEIDMNPGDALYVRGGVPHRCTTPGDHSLHISIDLSDRTPNIEQITQLANEFYNHGSAAPNVPTGAVLDHYIELLQKPDLRSRLDAATQHTRGEAVKFRQRIGNSAGISALGKFIAPKG
jgi:ribosomal protein L16 Arg81 hydroxylase